MARSESDYAMPCARAEELPRSKRRTARYRRPPTASASGLGAKGGTNAALAVVINTIVDALAELGASRIEIPATPERVWRAIRAAGRRT
jgi:aerobic carbon-monoxide dehydrogenase large subunit